MLCLDGFRKQIKSKSGRLYASTLHACSLFLVQRFEKPVLTTSGHQKMIPSHSFRLRLIEGVEGGARGRRAGNMLPSQDVVGGRGVPDKPGRKPHSLGRQSVCLPVQQSQTNGHPGRGESRKEHHNGFDKYTQRNLSPSSPPKPHLHTALKRKHSGAGRGT